MTDTNITHAGVCAIIGAPNAGKSTLVNRLVGAKVSIVTQKVQTTRFVVRGIAEIGTTQIVLVDTPGIFTARRRLDRAMVKAAWSGAEDADVTVHLIDAAGWVAERAGKTSAAQRASILDDRAIIQNLKHSKRRIWLALNKVDLFARADLLAIMQELHDSGVYEEIFMISASRGDDIDKLGKAIAARMPEGDPLFPPDQIADIPMRLLAAEITREKLMLRLHQELPYQLMVETESWEERGDGSVRIQQAIIVGRDTHKSMVLGKGGQTIKEIGKLAREDLIQILGRPVHLFLFVKSDPRWQERRDTYKDHGLDFDA
jgi:GTPase